MDILINIIDFIPDLISAAMVGFGAGILISTCRAYKNVSVFETIALSLISIAFFAGAAAIQVVW